MRAALKQNLPAFDAVAAFEALREGVLITDATLAPPGPHIIYVNPSFERMSGWTLPEIVGKSPRVPQGSKTDLSIFRGLRTALGQGRS